MWLENHRFGEGNIYQDEVASGKHNIFEKSCDEDLDEVPDMFKQQSIASMFQSRAERDVRDLLGQNILRRIVTYVVPFTAVESPAFQQILNDLPNIPLPFTCSRTLVRRIGSDFDRFRVQLIDKLARTYSTIVLSLHVWTSKNHKAILRVIGQWLIPEFKYKERVLEFSELSGPHSGENMAEVLQKMLVELQIEKRLKITFDNASNNETLASDLYFDLAEKYNSEGSNALDKRCLRFQGVDSYIRCLAHVLNFIVSDILSAMKSGDHKSAIEACDLLWQNKNTRRHSALAQLRIMALWILKTPQ